MSSESYRAVYGYTLAVSIALILGSRVLGLLWLESLISILVSLWMIALGYLVYRKSRVNFNESDADYYYYYGFILTLVTLAATFIPFYFLAVDVKRESIIGGFGLGLLTTFIGLTGRVLLYQLFERLSTGTETAVQTIGIVSNKFARELSELTASMTTNLAELSNSYRDSAASLQSATQTLASEVAAVSDRMNGLNEAVELTRTGLLVSGTKLSESLSSDGMACSAALTSVSESSLSLSGSLSKLRQEVDGIEMQKLTARSFEAANVLERLKDVVGLAADALQTGSKDIKQNLRTVSSAADSAGKGFAEVSQNLSGTADRLASVSTSFGALDHSVKDSAKSISLAAESVFSLTGAIQEGAENTLKSVDELAISIKPLASEFVALRVNLSKEKDSLKQSELAFSAVTQSLIAAASSFDELFSKIQQGTKRFEKISADEIDVLEESINQLSGTFAKVTSELKDLSTQLGSASGEIAVLQQRQTSLWNAQEDVQKLVSETHKALLGSLRSIKEEIG